MKLLIYEPDVERAEEMFEAAQNAGFQPVVVTSFESIELREHYAAAFITQESEPAWYDVISQFAARGIPAYLVGEPTIEAYQIINEVCGAGLINHNNTGMEMANYLRTLVRSTAGAGRNSRPMRKALKRSSQAVAGTAAPETGVINSISQGLDDPMSSVQRGFAVSGKPPDRAGVGLAGRSARRRRRDRDDGLRDQIVVIYSPKGGVGKSTFSVNFAFSLVSLMQEIQLRPILVDLDTSFGNVASMLDLRHQANLINWIKSDFKEDFSNLVVQHESGLDILLAPPNPLESGAITAEVVDKMLYTLNKRYDFVIVDTNPAIKLHHVKAWEWADTIVMLGNAQKPTLKDVKAMDGIFSQLRIDKSKVKLVLNMVPKQPSINIHDAINEIPFKCIGIIPEDEAVKVEENRGAVACLSRRAKIYGQAHLQICNQILGKSVLQNKWEKDGLMAKIKKLLPVRNSLN